MKQVLLLACLLFTMHTLAQVKLENIVKPGTKLIYGVEASGKKYDFIVTVKDLKGTSFNWEMTAPVSISGSITHTGKALANAYMMFNFFEGGDKTLDDNTLSVWLSQKCFNQFHGQPGKPIKMYLNGPDGEPQNMGTYTEAHAFNIMIDGKTETIYEGVVKQLVLSGNKYVPTDENNNFFTYYPSASFPVILKMGLDFSISLKEIQTK